MKKRLIRAIKSESGQAVPIVLVLLLLGGLLIAPSLSYAATSLNAGQIVERNVKGLYAADAGVENALWYLTKQQPENIPEQLPEINVNQMPVDIQTDIIGIYALYYGELVEVPEDPGHYAWLTVDGEMVWDEDEEAYEYTITVTWQPQEGEEGGGNCNLYEIGVRLPVDYDYEPGSAANPSFPNNLSINEPDDTLDGAGAYMLNWELPPGSPELSFENLVATQTFYVTGEESQDGDYTWVGAVRQDVGTVGEVIGGLYRITATATSPEGGEITVMADAMLYAGTGEITILLWQINPE